MEIGSRIIVPKDALIKWIETKTNTLFIDIKIANLLRAADFGISGLLYQKGNVSFSGALAGVYDNIEAVHQVIDKSGTTQSYALNMLEESNGTNAYLDLIGLVSKTLEGMARSCVGDSPGAGLWADCVSR